MSDLGKILRNIIYEEKRPDWNHLKENADDPNKEDDDEDDNTNF